MKIRRLLTVGAVVAALLLSSCGKDKPQDTSSTEAPSTTPAQSEDAGQPAKQEKLSEEILAKAVIVVNNQYIGPKLYGDFVRIQKIMYKENYGEDYLDKTDENSGKTNLQLMYENLKNKHQNDLVIRQYVIDSGTTVTKDAIAEVFDNYMKESETSGHFKENKEKFNIDEDFIRYDIENNLYIRKFVEIMSEEAEKDPAFQKAIKEDIYEVKARHILVKTKEEADSIRAKIIEGESFSDLAAEHSTDGSAQNGGDLGYFTRGRMVKPFEEASFQAEVGVVTEPVETQFGFHLILVEDKRTIGQMEEAGVAENDINQAKETMKQGVLTEKISNLLDELKESAKVEYHEDRIEE